MHYRAVTLFADSTEQPSHLSLADSKLLAGLLLRDLLPLGFVQNLQPVPLVLPHCPPVLAHLDPSLSIGHFYFAPTRPYHVVIPLLTTC